MMKRILGLVASLALMAMIAVPVHAADLSLDGNLRGNCGTATASGNGTAATATLANKCGVITTESLTGPTASEYTLTLTNTVISTGDIILWSVANGTNTTGLGGAMRATPTAASTGAFVVRQMSSASFNGTLTIRYFVIKP